MSQPIVHPSNTSPVLGIGIKNEVDYAKLEIGTQESSLLIRAIIGDGSGVTLLNAKPAQVSPERGAGIAADHTFYHVPTSVIEKIILSEGKISTMNDNRHLFATICCKDVDGEVRQAVHCFGTVKEKKGDQPTLL
jgi:hypothetical protein